MKYRIAIFVIIAIFILQLNPVYAAGPEISVSASEFIYSGIKGNPTIPDQFLTVTNTGDSALTISNYSLVGVNPASANLDYTVVSPPALPIVLNPNETFEFKLRFRPRSTQVGVLHALFRIESDDADESILDVAMFGLSANGIEGSNEPPLHSAMQTLGININVGGTGLILGTNPNPIGDEVLMPLMVKAGAGNVTIQPITRYSPPQKVPFGFFTLDEQDEPVRTEVGAISNTIAETEQYPPNHQTLNPYADDDPDGVISFDPGNAEFGFYTFGLGGRYTHTLDELNEENLTLHGARIYPAKDRAGNLIPNTFVIGFEDAANGDYQDYVFLVSNVISPDDVTPTPTASPTSIPTETETPVPPTATSTDLPTDAPTNTATDTPTLTDPELTATDGGSTLTATFTPTDTPTFTSTDEPTDEPTATPTIVVPIGEELIVNGDFEALGADGKPDLSAWKLKNPTGEKAKCNKDKDGDGIPDKIVSYEGNCAFTFKGSVGEISQLSQKPAVPAEMTAGDTLTLSLFTSAKDGATAQVKVKVKYVDTALPKGSITVDVPLSVDYVQTYQMLTLDGAPLKIKFAIKNASVTGKFWVDAASLTWLDNDAGLIPAPAALNRRSS